MAKIYVVTEGHYSDYGIVAVFSTEEKAQAYIDYAESNKVERPSQRLDSPRIEEYELDYPMDAVAQGLYPYFVRMDKNGNVDRVEVELRSEVGSFHQTSPTNQRRYITMTVLARDTEHAVKIANERRAMLIASGELEP